MKIFRFHKSFNSVVIGLAESGNFIPPEIAATMTTDATGYRSESAHLFALCECSRLREAGLIATNASPLVADLTRPLPESVSDSNIMSLYHQTTLDGRPVYDDGQRPLQQSDHQLRRMTFYQPFFQKMNAELDRLVEQFGSATLLMLRHAPSRESNRVCIAGEMKDSSWLTKIGIEHRTSADQPFIGKPPLSSQVKTYQLTLSTECFLERDIWSDDRADQTRETLGKIIDAFSKQPKH